MKECWCIPPESNAAFVAAMEDVLSVYQRPYDRQFPLVNIDEFCKQLLSEKQTPIAMRPGQAQRYDYEYLREGCASAFMIYAPLEGIREVFIGEDGRRTAEAYAYVLEYIAEEMFPDAEKIILVEDNLNTHQDASLYKTFEPEKARKLAERFERHSTPKHGSWLNIAEMEIAALSRTTFPDRISSLEEFRRLCEIGVARRNQEAITTNWRFTTEDARIKLNRLYPSIQY